MMEGYKRTVKRRMYLGIAGILLIGLMLCLNFMEVLTPVGAGESWAAFWHGLILGISVAAEILGVIGVIQYATMLSDDKKLRAEYVKENDERKVMIASKVGMNTYWLDVFGLFMGIIVGGYFHPVISLTCLGFTVYYAVLRVILTGYYDKKY